MGRFQTVGNYSVVDFSQSVLAAHAFNNKTCFYFHFVVVVAVAVVHSLACCSC